MHCTTKQYNTRREMQCSAMKKVPKYSVMLKYLYPEPQTANCDCLCRPHLLTVLYFCNNLPATVNSSFFPVSRKH